MTIGTNEKRPAVSQTNHNKMVKYIAESLSTAGYYVLADHIGWEAGCPSEINNYIPDIVASKPATATKAAQKFIFEVETCPTYMDEHTRAQLSAFSTASGITYIMLPHSCQRNGKVYDHITEMKQLLVKWNLTSVKIGTCNFNNGEIKYNV
ncbi:hypothetical protein [Bacillus sp. B-jedd]|uniref:hypothetical protein n=1 Tax=Bacillus sp. B-jedd TaxID=1476857 RepID=UPI00051570EB|nr:hypothetical protein [Bacillus sp. B-jedd]CEG28091.1 hypothetical protein BN1002_02970 [Bacillus sp. B-jedd]